MAWFTAPSGAACVAAYDAVGAASLADSYVNEANPGTFTAAPGIAPTWAYGSGWAFNGTTQYLTTGVTPADNWSAIVRFSGGSGGIAREVLGGVGSGNYRFRIGPFSAVNPAQRYYGYGGQNLSTAAAVASGVMAITGDAAYYNGASDGAITGTITGTPAVCLIGAFSAASLFWSGSIQALAIYSATLTLADVVAITAAMNALPAAATAPTMMQHHHAMLANRR